MTFAWLKEYVPRSLMGRAALILLLPIVSLQLVVGVVFIQRHYENVTRQMTQNLVLELAYIVSVIDEAPDPDTAREDMAPLLSALRLRASLGELPVPDSRVPWYDLSGRVLSSTLIAGLPGIEAVDVVTDPRVVTFSVATRQGRALFSFDRGRVTARNPHQLLVLMLVTSILLSAISFLFLKNQVRPIRRLAAAAQAFGRGRSTSYHPSGATEVRAAGSAFLDMRNRIERQIEQRTLMLSGVSHDLRTPLTRIRLALSMMEPGEEVDALKRDVADMEAMLSTFLDFARIEALDDPEDVDPEAFARDIVEAAVRGGGNAHFALAEGNGPVALRPMAVRRALENLVGNALRYGTRAEVSVSVMERSVRFSVEDDGPGIPPEQRETALKPFARLDASRNQNKGTGVGLGLAIASDIARQHGGVLRLAESARLGGLRADLVIAR